MTRERYKDNRRRSFELGGINPDSKKHDCHHIIQKRDYQEQKELWDSSVPSGRFDLDMVSNLFPVLKKDHAWINSKINKEPIRRRRKRKKRR